MLSIGTGSVEPTDSATVKRFRMRKQPRILSNWRHLFKILMNNMELALDCDKIWDGYYQLAASSIPRPSTRLFRINPTITGTLPALGDVHRMFELQKSVREHLATEPESAEVARRLVASSFYFDLGSVEEGVRDRCKVKGTMSHPDSQQCAPEAAF